MAAASCCGSTSAGTDQGGSSAAGASSRKSARRRAPTRCEPRSKRMRGQSANWWATGRAVTRLTPGARRGTRTGGSTRSAMDVPDRQLVARTAPRQGRSWPTTATNDGSSRGSIHAKTSGLASMWVMRAEQGSSTIKRTDRRMASHRMLPGQPVPRRLGSPVRGGGAASCFGSGHTLASRQPPAAAKAAERLVPRSLSESCVPPARQPPPP